ncbi:hypothetical protein R5R35_000490 [Gryllus longicercus]|uniref:Copper homeostasis protein cutC homolog n=1 Tax=Gryllus longicercus TaxID=2509291 RepID=A0AAN9V610_9ORTH
MVAMEVCVDCVESAVNAAAGGANRIELCSALSEGGLTPTRGLLEIVKSCVCIPVFAMLRPRAGSDFMYSRLEVEVMKKDAKLLMDAGADGFVFGALDESGRIDEDVCRELLNVVSPLPVTFHRAFDVLVDPLEGLETLVRLGFTRILTSGQETSAEKGVGLIKSLISKSGNRIKIMPGAGITENNLANILNATGAIEFHASARRPKKLSVNRVDAKCQMGSVDDCVLLITCEKLVKEMVRIANCD